MTDPDDAPPVPAPESPPESASVQAARRALEMKRNAAKSPPADAGGRRQTERAAAARSASKSKPAMRK